MGGINPYIEQPKGKLPTKKFKVTISNSNHSFEIDPTKIPFGETGLPGSLLDILLGVGIEIDHACGGVCACSTCHLYVKKGIDTCSVSEEAELDMLDMAPDVKPNSRLACQCIVSGEEDIEVEIPSWNRNYAREGT
jgi:2Fe-2S ferredoxin